MRSNVLEFVEFHRDTLDLIMDLVPIPLFVKDISGRYLDCNNAFSDFLSVSREKIIGKTAYDIWKKEQADIFFSQDNLLFQQGGIQIYETEISSADGTLHIVQFHKQVFTDSSGMIAGFLGAIFDITEKKELENSLAKCANTDFLTDLPNRRDGMAKLEALHKESERKKQPYCIAMIDIDHFKRLNDIYGHTNGDLVLSAFGSMARSTLRIGDICFRFGGEEFIVLMPDTKLTDGLIIMEHLRKSWAANPILLPDCQSILSTFSVGLTQYSAGDITFAQLLQESDHALYVAKNSGRNRTVCYSFRRD